MCIYIKISAAPNALSCSPTDGGHVSQTAQMRMISHLQRIARRSRPVGEHEQHMVCKWIFLYKSFAVRGAMHNLSKHINNLIIDSFLAKLDQCEISAYVL